MLDSVDSGCPEHCSAVIAHELSCLNIDIADLSAVHFHDKDRLKEHSASYTLYWSGKPKNKSHLSGVGSMIKNSITSKPENLQTSHSNRIKSLKLPLHKKKPILFSIYAPILQADPVEKDNFYTDLRCLTQKVPADDKIIILGDFNARGYARTMGTVVNSSHIVSAIASSSGGGLIIIFLCSSVGSLLQRTVLHKVLHCEFVEGSDKSGFCRYLASSQGEPTTLPTVQDVALAGSTA
ncbi:hypothetical protein WISP_38609 [Willisornis vidua]|uniref:Endonuclease/exonuclease/phosphatase domain-containing protein n=1 Tax=Willisornis vidua TaxID=1566151 RepID=A0ABQ9DM46_9PASS|nr:hypothetical protein WISP_38609 [Willisornis vidua]